MKRPIRTASTFVLDLDPKCKCGNFAEFFMEVHFVNACEHEPTIAQFFCRHCFKRSLACINGICELGGDVCETCGLEITHPSDIIVRIAPLG